MQDLQMENLNWHIEQLEKEKFIRDQKLEELQDILQDLEEDNFKLKQKLKLVISQVKDNEISKGNNESEIENMKRIVDNLREDNARLIAECKELENEKWKNKAEIEDLRRINKELGEKVVELERERRVEYKEFLQGKSESRNGKEKKEVGSNESKTTLNRDASTENYVQYFRRLKNEAIGSVNALKIRKTEENHNISDIKDCRDREGDIRKGYGKGQPEVRNEEKVMNDCIGKRNADDKGDKKVKEIEKRTKNEELVKEVDPFRGKLECTDKHRSCSLSKQKAKKKGKKERNGYN
jgi:hypothetical protein